MPNNTSNLRGDVYQSLKLFVNTDLMVDDNTAKEALVHKMAEISKNYQAYGKAEERDFRELTPLFARLFAFNNKYYYVYKAISDPNKIGYLSKRQYFLFNIKKAIWRMRGYAGSNFSHEEENFLSRNGMMASPYKMLKRSFKDNAENSRFLARFFPLEDKKTVNEDKLIALCDAMMQLNTGIQFVPCSVQDCYDLDFHGSNIAGSSSRACTNSCMHGKKVGNFYEGFGAEGRMIYANGRPVGRFLYWPMEGKEKKGYVDRLYVRGEYMNDALAALDREFPDTDYWKYPYLRTSNDAPIILWPIKNPEKFLKDAKSPYIDTFAYLIKNVSTGEYALSNRHYFEDVPGMQDYRYLYEMRSTSIRYLMTTCEYCNHVYWSGDTINSRININGSKHKLYCKGYVPRTKELQGYVNILRNNANILLEAEHNGTRAASERKLVFQI